MSSPTIVRHAPRDAGRSQSGIGLIELLIALLIGLFVVLGLTLVFINMKLASTSQRELGGLQDKERLALIVLTNTIQSARYFPDPLLQTADTALPSAVATGSSPAFASGQGITGMTVAGSRPEIITSRYVTAPNEAVTDCLGGINTTAANKMVVNSFSVDTTNERLQCSTDGGTNWVTLVSDVKSMQVLYGTDESKTGNADRYLDAASVEAAGLWKYVRTARVTVSFKNPSYVSSASTPSMTPAIDWKQTINLMNQP